MHYVISLKRREDRRESIREIFKDFNYSFFDAIDGKLLKNDFKTRNYISSVFKKNDFQWRKGYLGCALSHIYLWEQLLQDDAHEMYVIFEDDIKEVDMNFISRVEEYKKQVQEREDIDILFLGTHQFNESTTTYDITQEICFLERNNYAGGTFSYIIHKRGAHRILDTIYKEGIQNGIDYFLKIKPFSLWQTIVPVFYSEWLRHQNHNIDTDIQKNYEYYFPDWIFYSKLDQLGQDIYRADSNKNLLSIAESTDGCVAVNTLGYLKSNVQFPLQSSIYFKEKDGIYIHKKKCYLRVKLICNWCSSKKLCMEWNKMSQGDGCWDDIETTWEDENIDYYVIINYPLHNAQYIPEKTILFQMEPECLEEYQTWGTKTWGSWHNPDPNRFLHVRTHRLYHNNAFWQLNKSYSYLKNNVYGKENHSIISSICSSKYFDPGHKYRIDFLKFVESKNDPMVQLHIYNENNIHNFQSYCGRADPDVDKEKGILPYKYYFMCENNAEKNFITEKIWESLLCETLCFYWGCPNLSDYIDPQAYISLDMTDFEGSFQIIKTCIENNEWEKRLPILRKEKKKVLETYGFYPTLSRILHSLPEIKIFEKEIQPFMESHPRPQKVCFIHSCHLSHQGTEIRDRLISRVVDAVDLVFVIEIGEKSEISHPRIQYIHYDSKTYHFEIPTLKCMHVFSQYYQDCSVLYVHTKGVSYTRGTKVYENMKIWSDYMLDHLLDHTFSPKENDTSGCNYSDEPFPHYSGNFWWASTNYIRQLSLASLIKKHDAEWWILSGNPVKNVIANSGLNYYKLE
jgi:GR25 family glycosyltransferase involved in LPS biosynthesis